MIDLKYMNINLLAKWIWKLETSDGIWQDIIRSKYTRGKPLIMIEKKQDDSYFWKGMLNIKDTIYKFYKKNR